MDQTKRLYHLLKVSKRLKNHDKIILEIEDAIANGAVLNKPYVDISYYKKRMPPIFDITYEKKTYD